MCNYILLNFVVTHMKPATLLILQQHHSCTEHFVSRGAEFSLYYMRNETYGSSNIIAILATRYGLEGSGFQARGGENIIFSSSLTSRPDRGLSLLLYNVYRGPLWDVKWRV
jgi:hypothetical protein